MRKKLWAGPVLAVAIMALVPNVSGKAEVNGDRPSQLEDLLKQRRDTLAKAVDLRRQQYLNGNCDFEAVLTTQQYLHEAQLEAATTREDRVAALRKQLEVAEAVAALAQQRFKDGREATRIVGVKNTKAILKEIDQIR